MIYYKNGWHICNEKVKYIQHDEEITQCVMSEGHDWWLDFEEKWEHAEIIEFMPVEPTDEQISRLEEVNQLNIKEGYSTELGDYVESGVFPDGVNHILKSLQIQTENSSLSNYVLDVDMRLTMQELGL